MIYLSLFVLSFLAATILPFSSEAAFIGALQSGADKTFLLVAASTGNVLAIVANYYLGYFLYEKTKDRLFASALGKKAFDWGHRYGYAALSLSFLPLVGDPLTLVAGMVRLNFFLFLTIAGSLRVLRYYFIMINLS